MSIVLEKKERKKGWWTLDTQFTCYDSPKPLPAFDQKELQPLFNCLSLHALAMNPRAGLTRLTPALMFQYPTHYLPKLDASFLPAMGHNQSRSPAAGTKWDNRSQFLAEAETH